MIGRRRLLKLAALGVAERVRAAAAQPKEPLAKRVVLVTIGGIRRQESFSTDGVALIPHLYNDLLPKALFYPRVMNEGVTAHFNAISSILTGSWQHVDDWGREAPRDPTLFQHVQRQLKIGPEQTWVVTSNKALTANIGVGANVILAKQLLVEAVERIILGQSSRQRLERDLLLDELVTVLEDDYERIGWNIASQSSALDPQLKGAFLAGLARFIHGPDAPVSGDELTLFMAMEVLKRVKPALLMINWSDVEVAHSGTYSLHVAGIRRIDGLCWRLWQFLDSDPDYRGRTTLVVMPEFGRDPDGSSTNGFFNHRTDTNSCRMGWMMAVGAAVERPLVVERMVRQIDVAPSLAGLFGVSCGGAAGRRLDEFRA
jgi:hypothetical protein